MSLNECEYFLGLKSVLTDPQVLVLFFNQSKFNTKLSPDFNISSALQPQNFFFYFPQKIFLNFYSNYYRLILPCSPQKLVIKKKFLPFL